MKSRSESQPADLPPALLCPKCRYDLREQAAMQANRCPECALVLPAVPASPPETYTARYANCLEAMRQRFKRGWYDTAGKINGTADHRITLTSEGFLLISFLAVLAWSGFRPHDIFTWMLEVAPAVGGAVILVATWRRFQFTRLTYVLIFLHACILCVGGHYTYAQVPIGNWIRDWLHLSRNHYDRLGHLAQGFVPAIIARELLIRTTPLRPGKWLFFIVTCICLAISAAYELIEWQVAAWTGTAAAAFLGTQGDIWDTQKDMTCALIGAVLAQLFFARCHSRSIAKYYEV